MDKRAAQQLLKGNGAGFPRDEWRVLKSLLTAEGNASLPTLAEHARRDPELVVKVLTGNALCGWGLHSCPSLREAPEEVRAAIARAAQFEFGACAQRKAALLELERLAARNHCQPLVIKGAANALVYYEKESLRPSRDIDVVLEPDTSARLFPTEAHAVDSHEWGDASSFRVAGYTVEAHRFLISPERWGSHADLAESAERLPGFSTLRRPGSVAAFTIALLHFAHHFGRFSFDLLDMTRMVKAHAVDLEKAMNLWKERGLVSLIMPGLTLLDTVTPVISEDAWNGLFDSLSRRQKREVVIGLRLLSYQRLSKLRYEWFNSRFAPPSFARRVGRLFLGSKTITRQLTGLSPTDPRFWFFHLAGLPLKRVVFFWK